MKHSLIGQLKGILPDSIEEQAVLDMVNSFNPIWRLVPGTFLDEKEVPIMAFEVWLDTIQGKDDCYNSLKAFVDQHTGAVSYHVCTHDEGVPSPCVIVEEYRR